MSFRPALLIPTYNHGKALRATIEGFSSLCLPFIVVDDGSSDDTGEVLAELDAEGFAIIRYRREKNGGKGCAVRDGILLALREGYTHVLQVDADGQHTPSSAPEFLALGESFPEALIVGAPSFEMDAPKIRVWGREITNVLVWLYTGSRRMRDILCGYRLYPIASCGNFILQNVEGNRMDFDLDVAVRLLWQGIDVKNVPTPVRYPRDGISHFNYFSDNLRLAVLHTSFLLQWVVLASRALLMRVTARYSSSPLL